MWPSLGLKVASSGLRRISVTKTRLQPDIYFEPCESRNFCKSYLGKYFLLHSSHSHALPKIIGHFCTVEIIPLYELYFYQHITQECYMSIYSKKLLLSSSLSLDIKGPNLQLQFNVVRSKW